MNHLTPLIVVLFFTSCAAQKNHRVELKNKTWHIGVDRYAGNIVPERHINGFSDHLYLHFLTNDSITITYHQYSPGIGDRTTTIHGTYAIQNNVVNIKLIEPQGHSITNGGRPIQYSVAAFHSVASEALKNLELTALPTIVQYTFSILDSSDSNNIKTTLTLIDTHNTAHSFGQFRFDLKEVKY